MRQCSLEEVFHVSSLLSVAEAGWLAGAEVLSRIIPEAAAVRGCILRLCRRADAAATLQIARSVRGREVAREEKGRRKKGEEE